jgi:hypothetical protein
MMMTNVDDDLRQLQLEDDFARGKLCKFNFLLSRFHPHMYYVSVFVR